MLFSMKIKEFVHISAALSNMQQLNGNFVKFRSNFIIIDVYDMIYVESLEKIRTFTQENRKTKFYKKI